MAITARDLAHAGAPSTTGTTNDLVRRQNLSAVLSLLHLDGPLSRAQLGDATRLNRSTIAGLVLELTDLGLAREVSTPSRTGRAGRPTIELQADESVASLSLRAEAHAITAALVGLGGVVHARLRHDTVKPVSPPRFVEIATSLVGAMRADIERHYRLVGAGVAVPGLVDDAGSVLVSPPLGWKKENVAQRLRAALGMPVHVGNDASIGALAESRFGIGRDAANLLYLGGSLYGIGGGVILDGTLVRGTSGYAGELGHTVVQPHGRPCLCGRRGCLEAEVNVNLLLAVLGRRRLDEDELDVELGVVRDPAVLRELSRQVELLSQALTNFVNAFSPEVIVLSGYLGVLYSVARERLSEAVRIQPLGAEGRTVRLERAHLRSRLMQVGPAELAFADLLTNPGVVRTSA